MIPLAVRIGLTVVGVAMFAASFFVKTSVDRGLRITRDAPPSLSVDAGAFVLRAMGAVIVGVGLLTWVVTYTKEHGGGLLN